MRTQEPLEEGRVIEALPATQFRVELRDGRIVRAHLSGKMKINNIRVLMGDRVTLVVSGEIGRIMRRL